MGREVHIQVLDAVKIRRLDRDGPCRCSLSVLPLVFSFSDRPLFQVTLVLVLRVRGSNDDLPKPAAKASIADRSKTYDMFSLTCRNVLHILSPETGMALGWIRERK